MERETQVVSSSKIVIFPTTLTTVFGPA